MILIPIGHQNLIQKSSVITWVIIFTVSFISLNSLPSLIQDEINLQNAYDTNDAIFFIESELYQSYLKEQDRRKTHLPVIKHLVPNRSIASKKIGEDNLTYYLMAQADTMFQKALKKS